MNIYAPPIKVFTLIESFSFGFHFLYFLINTSQFLSNDAMKFLKFFLRNKPLVLASVDTAFCTPYDSGPRSPRCSNSKSHGSKANLEPNQILNWLKQKYNFLNKQKSIFENKMAKVALSLRT